MKYLVPLILESKNVGIIYHFTSIENLYFMLENNNFKLKSEYNYVSFTRNSNLFSSELNPSKLQTRIMIDGNKLSNYYKITPYKDFSIKKEHGEAEERFIFSENTLKYIDIKNFIIEIDIIDEPLFRNYKDEFYDTSPNIFKYKDGIIKVDNPEPIIKKHIELLKFIEDEIKKYNLNFDINVVSKFTNPKYQDKYIIKKLN